MKNTLTTIFVCLLATLLFTQCNKDDNSKVFNARFYTTKANGKLSLYVDDVYKGELPYFSNAPDCGATYSDAQKPLNTQLPSGEYRIAGKNSQGQVTSYGIMKISRNKMSASGGIGGMSLNSSEECLTIGLSE